MFADLLKSAEISIETIKELNQKKKSDAKLLVWGCLSKIDPKSLREVYDGPTFVEKDASLFNEILQAQVSFEDVDANCLAKHYLPERPSGIQNVTVRDLLSISTISNIFYKVVNTYHIKFSPIAGPRMNSNIFYIKVSTGCTGHCTYCGIRISRGAIRSKPIEKVIAEFRKGLQLGYKYFYLLGTDLGCYGKDLGFSLCDLLNAMIKVEGNYKIAIRNLNPQYLKSEISKLKQVFRSGKIWLIESPVESGSNRILKLMGRKYTAEEFRDCIRTINREFPGIIIRTQIMVGFPTETEEDFMDSINLLRDAVFDYIEVYKFSKRPGTLAAEMNGQISDDVSEKRLRRLKLKAVSHITLRKLSRVLSF
jgi:MiaB/RimO family radical SAM methylthiotransferase